MSKWVRGWIKVSVLLKKADAAKLPRPLFFFTWWLQTAALEHEGQRAATLLPHACDLQVVVVHLAVKGASEAFDREVQIGLVVND